MHAQAYHSFRDFALVAFALVIVVRLRDVVLRGGFCLSCGGHGKHRDDCPLRD